MEISLQSDRVELNEEQIALFNGLTRLQQNVALNSLSGMGKAEAYVRAGGTAKNDNSIAASVSEILNNPKVKKFMDSVQHLRVSAVIMSREEMLERLSMMARTQVNDVLNIHNRPVVDLENGMEVYQGAWALKDVDEMKNGGLCAISEVSLTKNGLTVKLHDQKAAMKQIADILGYNKPQQVEVTGNMTHNVTLTPAQKKLLDKTLDEEY